MTETQRTPNSNRGFDAQFLGSPPYWKQLELPGVVASVDGVRLKYTYSKSSYDHCSNERIDTLNALLSELTSDSLFLQGLFDISHRESSFRIGNYAHTVAYSLPDGNSFAVLVGRYCADASVKQVAPEAVLDFNPNKVTPKAWMRIHGILCGRALSVVVQRYDLALDFPIQRSLLELQQRPGSGYQKFVDKSGAVTEYTGERSHHGAIKLYDKGMELGLRTPLTRLEITVEPKRMKSLKALMPAINSLAPLELSLCFEELPFPVQACILFPELTDRLRASASHNTWSKYKKMITDYGQTNFTLADDQLAQIERYIRDYVARLPMAHLYQ